MVFQPLPPASTSGCLGNSSPFSPYQWAIPLQIPPGVKQVFRCLAVFGSEPLVTSEKVCGPTMLGIVMLTTFSPSPSCTVDGPKKPIFLPSILISMVVTPSVVAADSAAGRFGTTGAASKASAARGAASAATLDFFRFMFSFRDDKGD